MTVAGGLRSLAVVRDGAAPRRSGQGRHHNTAACGPIRKLIREVVRGLRQTSAWWVVHSSPKQDRARSLGRSPIPTTGGKRTGLDAAGVGRRAWVGKLGAGESAGDLGVTGRAPRRAWTLAFPEAPRFEPSHRAGESRERRTWAIRARRGRPSRDVGVDAAGWAVACGAHPTAMCTIGDHQGRGLRMATCPRGACVRMSASRRRVVVCGLGTAGNLCQR
jgi:hypothetical protein